MHRVVLIVEDDKDIRDAMESSLTAVGYKVLVAENGQEALDLLQDDQPCVIFLDLMMPVMDGWEFRRRQLSDPRLAEIPTVVVSADGRAKQKAQRMDVKDALVKPIEFTSLLDVTAAYCG